jgi:hypothetical protein
MSRAIIDAHKQDGVMPKPRGENSRSAIATALGAASVLAAARPIVNRIVETAGEAFPSSQRTFEAGCNLAAKNISTASLAAIRDRLPGGKTARTAFDGGVALGNAKRRQIAMMASTRHRVTGSPLAVEPLEFIRRLTRGQRVSDAALSLGESPRLEAEVERPTSATAARASRTRASAAPLRAASSPRSGNLKIRGAAMDGSPRVNVPSSGTRTASPRSNPGLGRRLSRNKGIIGTNVGGPGEWVWNIHGGENMDKSPGGRAFQEQVTGVSAMKDYRVVNATDHKQEAAFDGWDPKRRVLQDAKNWNVWGSMVRPIFAPHNPRSNLGKQEKDRLEKIVEEAQRQAQAAASHGAKVEWVFSNDTSRYWVEKLLREKLPPELAATINFTSTPLTDETKAIVSTRR